MDLPGTLPQKPKATSPATGKVPAVVVTPPPPRPAKAAARTATTPAAKEKQWFDWAEDPSSFISFIWSKGTRAIVLPYASINPVVQTDKTLVFTSGLYRVTLKFSDKFPLPEFMLQFHFQFVIRLFAVPGDVTITAIKIDPETNAEIPV